MQVKNMLAALTALALTAATAIGQSSSFGPSLPVTNITVNGNSTISLKWDDYSDIVGFQLYTTLSLETPDWKPMTDVQTGLTRMGTDETIFALTNTVVTVPGDSPTSRQFYRLVSIKGKHKCVEIITVGEGEEKVYYIQVDKDPDVYIEVDDEGNVKKPLIYWKNIHSVPRKQVWEDGEGGWSEEFVCLCDDDCDCAQCPHLYPVEFNGSWWTLFEGTRYIYAEAYPDGLLKFPPRFIKTDTELPETPIVIIDPYEWDDYSWTLSETTFYTFPSALESYGAQGALTVTISNLGDMPGTFTASSSSANFTVTPTTGIAINKGANATFTVVPNTGLTANTYVSTITVDGGTGFGTKTFIVVFTVNALPKGWNSIDHTLRINLADGPDKFFAEVLSAYAVIPPSGKSTEIYLRYVKPGSFMMGTPQGDAGLAANQVNATLTKGYYIGVYPLTEAQFDRINASGSANVSALPKSSISWDTINAAGGVLENLQIGVRGRNPSLSTFTVALPTEAQWEFACRAGTIGTYNDSDAIWPTTSALDSTWGARLSAIAWWAGNNVGSPYYNSAYNPEGFPAGRKAVGLRNANGAGLYDMIGNVGEWCNDWHDALGTVYPSRVVIDPTGAASGTSRVNRGAAYAQPAVNVRLSSRFSNLPGYENENLGLRLGATVP